ncbi:hypothetical protein HK44_008875 [Pseudomonas fluorescens HK44]|uniref:Transposase n=1 Tax=Pseudomonas fluorescens HK44 TaxID=1042209 RepID=A0A010RNS6_PSEFL|nr:hypothetical protein HK44_008875 [Pseudomonas fluorescens HK44]
MARPAAPFALTQSWLRMGSLAQNLAQRARILLLLVDGLTPNTVAEQMQVSASVIFKWRKRYQEATHWSVRLMAKYAQVSTWQVRQVWAAPTSSRTG